jgi:hypothetical protein
MANEAGERSSAAVDTSQDAVKEVLRSAGLDASDSTVLDAMQNDYDADEATLVSGMQDATAMSAYQSAFDQTPELSALWTEAAASAGSWSEARTNFWTLVNDSEGPDAEFVRTMLDRAGYELTGGDGAPMLRGYDGASDPARRLSIDHATPNNPPPGVERTADLTLEPANLRFMLQDDNARRGNRYDEEDRLYRPPDPDGGALTAREAEKRESFRERVMQLLFERKANES